MILMFFTCFEKHDLSIVLEGFKQTLSPSASLKLYFSNVIKPLKAVPFNKAPTQTRWHLW